MVFVSVYPQVDLLLSPWEKPKPAKYLDNDPLAFVLPLMDAYAGSEREKYRDSPILHPVLADIESLPRNMLFLCAEIDILFHEQRLFVDRLKDEAAALNRKFEGPQEASQDHPSNREDKVSLASEFEGAVRHPYNIEGMFFDGQIHGWIECMYLCSYMLLYTLTMVGKQCLQCSSIPN